MISGIGVDIVSIARVRATLSLHGDRFARHLLAPDEWDAYCAARDAGRFLAKRFAAKEAFAKALGTGLRAPVSLTSIAVVHDEAGRPQVRAASKALADWLTERRLTWQVSISDEADYAVAFAVVSLVTNAV
ncbi:MAG: holo-ACP synthase [Rhodocyclaceae bacterium]|nr:holo-ACP synthase [Rhodocyclaceae bacterium]